jgi:hypothetical protein
MTIVLVGQVGLLSLFVTPALGQIGNDIKTASNVTGNAPAIAATVKKDVAALAASPNATTRNVLISNAMVPGSAASVAFLDAYTISLNTELQALEKDPNLAVRLNGAIVAAQVAEKANNARLAEAITAFVNDKSEPVAMWGLRGAKWVIPSLIKPPVNNPKHPLFDAIINAVKTHHTGLASGWIATDAYSALALELNPSNAKDRPTPAMLTAMITPVQNVLAVRIDQYKEGVPASPTADAIGTGFLSHPAVWPVQTPAQQLRTLQLYSDLLSLAAQQLAAPSINETDKNELTTVIKLVGSAIAVTAPANSPLAAASKQTNTVGRAMPPAQIQQIVDGIYPALIKDPKYKTLTAPPKIVDTKPAPAPATAPTTLPTGPGTEAPIPPPPPVPPPSVPPPAAGGAAPGPGPGRPPPGGARPPLPR